MVCVRRWKFKNIHSPWPGFVLKTLICGFCDYSFYSDVLMWNILLKHGSELTGFVLNYTLKYKVIKSRVSK